jgi:antirestriction protein ArdC
LRTGDQNNKQQEQIMARQSAEQIRQQITEMMVKAIDEGVPPWRKPWSVSSNTGLPCNFVSRRRYTGINPLILMFWSHVYNYDSKFWGSASAWLKNVGAHVKREERATYITLFKMMPKRDPKTGQVMKKDGKDILFPMLREFPVFNVDQIQAPAVETLLDGRCRAGSGSIIKTLLGVDDRKARTAVTTKPELLKIAEKYLFVKDKPKPSATREKIAEAIHAGIEKGLLRYLAVPSELNDDPDFGPAEEFIRATGVTVKQQGSSAHYDVIGDFVSVPKKKQFASITDFYETVFHELIHWTQKESRVGIKKQDDDGHQYAFNELVAEIGACLLLVELGVPMADKMMPKSKAYVKNWLARMKGDPKFIFDAATQAGKAVDFLLAFIGMENPPYEEEGDSESEQHVDLAVA